MISVFFIVSLVLSVCLTWALLSPSSWVNVMDHPNERSLHSKPISRAGGLAIMTAFFLTMGAVFLLGEGGGTAIFVGALLVAVISFLDDCYSLSASIRFVIHFCAAFLLVASGYQLTSFELPGVEWQWPAFIAITVSSFFVVWSINLFNFMDGMDGFSAGMAISGFSCFAFLGWQAEHQPFMVANLILVGAVAGFLFFNFPPAKIFMGDAGASTLGFLMAAFSLWASMENIFPIWVAVLVFSPFIVDATFTLIRRVLAREKVWEAHKTHLYQRLVRIGWGHKKTVLHAYLLMAVCAISACFVMQLSSAFQIVVIVCWIVIYIMLPVKIRQLEQHSMFEK